MSLYDEEAEHDRQAEELLYAYRALDQAIDVLGPRRVIELTLDVILHGPSRTPAADDAEPF